MCIVTVLEVVFVVFNWLVQFKNRTTLSAIFKHYSGCEQLLSVETVSCCSEEFDILVKLLHFLSHLKQRDTMWHWCLIRISWMVLLLTGLCAESAAFSLGRSLQFQLKVCNVWFKLPQFSKMFFCVALFYILLHTFLSDHRVCFFFFIPHIHSLHHLTITNAKRDSDTWSSAGRRTLAF